MKILFAVDEAFPLYKIGGLGDVGGSLPKALFRQQIDVRLTLPKHPEIDLHNQEWNLIDKFPITYNRQQLQVSVLSGFLPRSNVPTYLFQEEKYLSEYTDASDNHADKFTVFSLAIAAWLNQPGPSWVPHLIHCHDWHTAMLPVILKHTFQDNRFKTITTIHNLAYQGNTDSPILRNLDLKTAQCQILAWDSIDNHINILLEGLLHSDIIGTVSPTYAKEILTSEYGETLDQILTAKKDQIIGILNGLDYDTFNPETDPHLHHKFSANNYYQGKLDNKHQLQRELDLPVNDNLLVGFVGRVDPKQKGIALIIEALEQHQLPLANSQFVFLGTGDPILEQGLHQHGDNLQNCSIITRFDEPLARQIYAASDLMIIPSKYEPCGLVQMIAMRYGTLPIARKTGGLADTIIHQQDGFLFDGFSSSVLIQAIQQAADNIADPNKKDQLIRAAMTKDFSWNQPAVEYAKLYRRLLLDQ